VVGIEPFFQVKPPLFETNLSLNNSRKCRFDDCEGNKL